MNYSASEISTILNAHTLCKGEDGKIQNVIYDTRKISFPEKSIFFAFKGAINDGHNYIEDAYRKGIRNFVVSKKINCDSLKGANVIFVHSCLQALQKLAQYHRSKFNGRIIAITGSNGKTIIKEWLGKALSRKFKFVKSPKSYNSQIGVALSLLQIEEDDELALIEAGISKKHEMRFLERMIKPQIGIFTNLGDAHSSGFPSMEDKLDEKIELFKDSGTIICCMDHELVYKALMNKYPGKIYPWSHKIDARVRLNEIIKKGDSTRLKLEFENTGFELSCTMMSREFLENLMHVITCLLYLGYNHSELQDIIDELDHVQNRLELRDGINGNLLINDSYSLDMASMQLALEFQDLHTRDLAKVLIFSDFDQQVNKLELFTELKRLIEEKKITKTYAIGLDAQYHELFTDLGVQFYASPQALLSTLEMYRLRSCCILIKGARRFHFENIFHKLSSKVHETVLETSFTALDHNLNIYKLYLQDDTRIMAVIKADAYGSGSVRMAQYLEHKKIDYLAVAIIDEAVEIRESGCSLDMMVFNVHNEQIDLLWEYQLEPEVYSITLLEELIDRAERLNQALNIHLKLDTGMHRLGFMEAELDRLLEILKKHPLIKIKSLFSHMAGSDNPDLDAFSLSQIERFDRMSSKIEAAIGYTCLKHILNTGGIIRFGQHHYDMVRIGLGIYGIDETKLISEKLEKVHTLKARILQIKNLKAGDSTGYNRSGKVDHDTKIAIVSIGYADGLMRLAGTNGYSFKVRGILCPIIGDVCMDVCMLDVSHLDKIEPGDEVIIFNKELPIEELAKACQTISYEVISRIAPRVKRAYTYD